MCSATVIWGDVLRERLFLLPVASMASPAQATRLVTHVLSHASLAHLSNNLVTILLLGPGLERRHGASLLFASIVAAAVATAVANFAVAPSTGLQGASGVVFCWLFWLASSEARVDDNRVLHLPVTTLALAALHIAREVADAVADTTGSVSRVAHLVGGLVGFGMVLLHQRDPHRDV